MKNLSYLSEGVERSRIESAVSQSTFDYRAALLESAEIRSPPVDVKYLGADKYLALITGPGHFDVHFNHQFSVSHVKEITHVEAFSDTILFVRCAKPLEWVKEEIRMGFVPF